MDARPITGHTGVPPNAGAQQAPRPVGPGVSHPATTVQGEPHQAQGEFTNTSTSTATGTSTATTAATTTTATVEPWMMEKQKQANRDKFTNNMRNAPATVQPAVMAQAPPQSVVIPGHEPLTATMLAAAPLQEREQMLGERLFPFIERMYPDLAGKITGMLLEIDNSELLHMLESQESLKAKVEEAVAVLQAHQAKEAAAAATKDK